jgi:glycosyltransferase involved in cell wall biosynthesis
MAGRHFLHVFPSFDQGGMEVRAAMVMDLLGPPHRHTVLAMNGRTGTAGRVRGAALEFAPPPPKAGFLATGRAMAARIGALRPDLVLTYNWGAIESVLGCRLLGFRALIHHEEGFGLEETERMFKRRAWARRLLLRRAAAVVVPSQNLRAIALRTWRLPASRVRYLPNGVDLARFPPRAPRAGRDVVIGCVAHFRPEKDVPALITAFARCAQRARARLVLIGDGVERARGEQLARDLGVADRVQFAGAVADTAKEYDAFDVFALASRTEQMPLSVLEAMAAGLPIAAPAVGDIAVMVHADNAPFIVPPRDPDALAHALDRLIADPELRARLGAKNRARCVAEFQLADRLAAHLAMYEEVMTGVRRTD